MRGDGWAKQRGCGVGEHASTGRVHTHMPVESERKSDRRAGKRETAYKLPDATRLDAR